MVELEQFYEDRKLYQGRKIVKVAVPRIDDRTTRTCLNVAGQRKGVDEKFHLTGSPAPFGRDLDYPPFHWNCRTVVLMDIEGVTTVNSKEIKKDATKQKRTNKENKKK
jgi:hypothetical protein